MPTETDNLQLKSNNLLLRPPIVVVMGHVDHGKTTLLDYIRKTNVAGKEAGGITQSIGAYTITHNQQPITFIDTPGHEAFSKMRTRGANVADLAILVVAADDGVKPQTKESIEILQSAKTPFVVAINKIDKNNADIERAKQELMRAGVLLEGFGGTISWHGISAKTGEGVNELLDLVALTAELENLTYNPGAQAKGVIIEAKMDSRRGIMATAIVKDGILKEGDKISTPTASGKIKILENFLGERVEKLEPSSPALIIGFENLPQTGEGFTAGSRMGENLPEIPPMQMPAVPPVREITPQPNGKSRLLNLIVKADVSGSLEALVEIIKTIPEVKIISEAVGDITDGDVKSAISTNSLIVGFKVRLSRPAQNLIKGQSADFIASGIIYELLEKINQKIEAVKKPPPLGELEALAVFSQKGKKQLIGGKVLSGLIKIKTRVKVNRGESELGTGKIISMKKVKQEVNQATAGEECGVMIESDITIAVGDFLIYQ